MVIEALSAGAKDFLVKPFDAERVVESCARSVPKGKDRERTETGFPEELAVIGTGHATIALSQMLQGRMFKLVVPDAQMLPFTEAADYMGGLEQVVVGIFVVISGDVRGYMACLHPWTLPGSWLDS